MHSARTDYQPYDYCRIVARLINLDEMESEILSRTSTDTQCCTTYVPNTSPIPMEEIIDSIKDIIRAVSDREMDKITLQLYKRLQRQEHLLADLVDDRHELINVRAMAARLLIARIHTPEFLSCGDIILHSKVHSIEKHNSPLIRLGALLGFADAGNWEKVKEFSKDPHSTVAEEAKELIEDAEF